MDNLTPEQRGRAMRAVKGTNTSLERGLGSALHRAGLRYRKNAAALPGKPDFVFARARVVVFVDGDFWHGWRFPAWKHKLADFWRDKIEGNRRRDRRVRRRLGNQGWRVVRVWGHEIERDLEAAAARVVRIVAERLQR